MSEECPQAKSVSGTEMLQSASENFLFVDLPSQGCGHCFEPGGCGGISPALKSPSESLSPDEALRFSISRENYFFAVFITYCCPTFWVIFCAGVGNYWGLGASVLGACIGLVVALVITYRLKRRVEAPISL